METKAVAKAKEDAKKAEELKAQKAKDEKKRKSSAGKRVSKLEESFDA